MIIDEDHLIAAARYVPMNPVRAGLVGRPQDWPWSSAAAHLAGRDDGLVITRPLLDRIVDFAAFLAEGEDASASAALRSAETTGRPLGNEAFIQGLERILGRRLARGRPGPAARSKAAEGQQELWG